jgi:hypothetical protein
MALMSWCRAGRVRIRTVAVFPQRGGGLPALRLGKKRLGGAFATYKDCK